MTPAANLTHLYGQLPLQDRFAAARRDGFSAVEILSPYDQSAGWYAQRLNEHGLRLILVNTPTDAARAPRGRAALPGQASEFRDDFRRAAEFCRRTGCKAVHVMAGCVTPQDTGQAVDTLLGNLEWACAEHPDLTLQLEALNHFDVPAYLYSDPAAVRAILSQACLPNAGMQFDFYHVLRQGLDVATELEASLPWIRHVQVAGNPARQEPDLKRDAGVLAGFQRLHVAAYQGFIGYEYRPAGQVAEGLRWADALQPYFSYQPTVSSR